jgi:hypothetical protein
MSRRVVEVRISEADESTHREHTQRERERVHNPTSSHNHPHQSHPKVLLPLLFTSESPPLLFNSSIDKSLYTPIARNTRKPADGHHGKKHRGITEQGCAWSLVHEKK